MWVANQTIRCDYMWYSLEDLFAVNLFLNFG